MFLCTQKLIELFFSLHPVVNFLCLFIPYEGSLKYNTVIYFFFLFYRFNSILYSCLAFDRLQSGEESFMLNCFVGKPGYQEAVDLVSCADQQQKSQPFPVSLTWRNVNQYFPRGFFLFIYMCLLSPQCWCWVFMTSEAKNMGEKTQKQICSLK